MSRPIIDVGLKIDISDQIKLLQDQLDSLATQAGKGLSKTAAAEINSLKNEIAQLENKLQNLGNSGGVSNNKFNKTVSTLNKEIVDLQKRTYALEEGMSSLIQTLSKNDGGKFKSTLKEIEVQMESLRRNTADTISTIKDFRELSAKSANTNLINQKDISSNKTELKELEKALSTIKKIQDEDFDVDTSNLSEKSLLKTFDELYEKVIKTDEALKKTDTNTESYSLLRQELLQTAESFSKLYMSVPMDISDDALNSVEKLSSRVNSIISDLELSISTRINQINSALANIGNDKTSLEKNKLSIPLTPGTSATALAKRVRLVIDETQGKINNYPLKVQFVLASGYSSKKTNTMLRQFQKEIDQIPDSIDKKNIQNLFDTLSKDFKKELDIKITASTLKDTEKSITSTIDRIKTLLKKNLSFNITPELNEESRTAIQTQLDSLSKTLKLKIQELDLSDISTDELVPKTDSVNKIDVLSQKIDDIKNDLVDYPSYLNQIKDSLDKIILSFDGLKEYINISDSPLTNELDTIIAKITELSEVFKKAFNVLSSSDLNTMFAKLKEQIESFGNFNLTKNFDKKALEEIITSYREYLSLGGTNTLNELTSNQKALSKLIKEYEKQENVSNEIISTLNTENTSIQELKSNVDSTASSIEKFSHVNSEVLNSITSSLQALDSEGKAFEKISEILNKLGTEKGSAKLNKTIEGLTQIQSLLTEPISDNSLLKSLISLAEQGTNLENLATVLKATKKQIENASNAVNNENLSNNLLGNKGQSIISNVENYIQKTKNYGSVISTSLNEGKNGIIEITSLIKSLDGTYQQYILSTSDGEHFKEEQINKSTAAIAKQVKTYAQVQQAFERMRASSKNQTSQSFFDIDNNPEVWEEMISLVKKYYAEIGNLKNIMRQTRQDSSGNLLESFVLKGDKGSVTVGREGETVASKQDLANISTILTKLKELSNEQKKYNELKEKVISGTALSSEIEQLSVLDLKYSNIINDINQLSSSLKMNDIASEELTELLNSRVSDYNDVLKKYYEQSSKTFSDKNLAIINQNKSFSSSLSSEIESAQASLLELYNLIYAHKDSSTPWSDEEIARVIELKKQIDRTSASLKDQSEIVTSTTQVDKLLKKIYKDLNDNTNMSSELQKSFLNLAHRIENIREEVDSVSLKKFTDEFTELDAKIQKTGQTGKSFWHQMATAIQSQNAQFLATYFSFQDIIRYIRTMVSTVTTLDTALTELRKVSDASTSRLVQNFRTSADTAKELGATVSEVINMTADWARLGYSVDEAEELARVTTLFQNVGDDMSAETASEDMISTIQGFQLEVSEATDVVDKYNEVANNFAIDTYGIGEALKRSAASFNAANTDLSEAIALVTATNEVIQNPESVGTLWKTMSARIRGATTELEELGEETDEFTDSTTSKLRDLVKSLTGFDIMEDADTYKSVYEIILGIGQAWEQLTDIEQASLGEALAGKRNSNALYAVLGNLDTLQEAYQTAQNASGSAMKEQENYMRSIQYSIDVFKASWQELQADLLDSQFVKNVIDFASNVVQGIDDIADATNGIIPILAIASAGIGMFIKTATGVKNFTEFASAIRESTLALSKNTIAQELETASDEKDIAVNSVQQSQQRILTAGLSEENIAIAQNTFLQEKANKQRLTSNMQLGISVLKYAGVSAAIMALTAVIYECATANSKLAEKTSELYNKFEDSKSEIDSYKSEISELQATLADNNVSYEDAKTARERLLTIQEELISKYGAEAGGILAVTEALNGQVDALDKLSKAQWNKTLAEINDDGSWFEWIGNKYNQAEHGVDSQIGVILKELEATPRGFYVEDFESNFVKSLENIGANITSVFDGVDETPFLRLSNNVDDAIVELNKYIEIADKVGASESTKNALLQQLNALSELTDKYGEFYDQYVLYEKIFKDNTIADYYGQLAEIGSAYKQAITDDDTATAERLSKNYAEIFGKAISSIDDKSVINYFRDMYPELQAEINKWNLKADLGIDLDTDSESAITEEGKQLVEAIEQFRNIEELMAHDETDEYFAKLATAADKYGYSIEELIKLLSQYYNLNFDFRDDTKLVDNVISRDSNYGRKDVDTQRHERTNIDNAFELLSEDNYQIAESFSDEQWNEVITKVKEVQKEQGVAYLSAQEYADVISEVADKWTEVEEIVEETEKTAFSEQLSSLNTITDNLEQIQSIADDIADGEDFDFSALSSDDFAEAFSSLDSYEQFIETISSNTSSLTETQDALNKLATEYIAAQSAAGLFNEETKKTAIAMLNQAGIANAEAVVESQIAQAKRDTILADIEATTAGQKLTAVMHDEELAALDSVQALKQRAQAGEEVSQQDAQNVLSEQAFQNASIQTKAQIISLIAQLQVFNNTGLDVSQKLQALQQLATQAGLTGTAVAYATQLDKYNSMKSNMSEDAIKHLEDTGYFKDDMSSYMSEVVSEMTKYQEEAAKVVPSSNAVADSSGSAADAAEEEADAMSDLSSELDELQDAYSKLLSIQEEYNTNGKISVDSAQELMQMDFRYLAMLQTEGGALKLNEQAFQSVAQAKLNEMKITMMRNALNTMQSITTEAQAEAYLAMCTGEANMATAEATALQAALQAQMQGTTGAIAEAYNVIYSGLQNAMALLGENFANVDFSTLSSSATDATADVADTVEEEFEEVFDWLDRRMTVLQKKADLFAAKRANADKTYFSRDSGYNYYINRERSVYKQQKETAKEQVKAYEEEYKKAIEGLDADTIAAIEGSGKGLQTITDEGMADAINKAIEWKDKLDDAKISIEEIQTKINDLSLEKFTYLAEVLERKMKKLQRSIDFSEFNSDMAEAMGYSTTSGVYSKLSTQYDKLALKQQKELQRLEAKRTQMIKNGNLTENSSQDLEMQDQIYELQQSILDTQLKQVQAARDARDAEFERFKTLQQIADSYEDELSSIRSLHNEDNAIDDDAKYTNSAYSMMLTDYYNYTSNLNQVSAYEKQLKELRASYEQGIMGADEYQEKEQEIRSAMYESAEAAKEAKDAIVELAKERIEKEIDIIEDQIDAYNELIDAQKDALQSEKDLHDYQKSIAESTKEIAVIERQLAAIENDNSASAIAKRRKLEEELASARETLEEKQYEHSIDSAESALDAQASAYEEAKNVEIARLEEKLKDVDALFAEATDGLNAHMTEALQGMTSTLTEYGITMSEVIADAIISGVKSGTTGASSYISNVANEQSDYTSSTDAAAAAIAETEKKSSYKQTQASTAGELKSMISQLVKSKVISRELADKWELASKTNYSVNAINNLIANDKSSTAVDKINTLINKVKDKLTGKTTAQKKKLKEFIEALRTWKSNIKSSGYYYSGAHNLLSDQLAWTQEYGDEAILSPTRNAILTPLKAGDSVLTAKQTDALYSFAKNPLDFLKNLNVSVNPSDVVTPQGIILNIDNVLTVQGDVNNSNAKQIADIAQLAINKAFNDFSSKIRKA